MAADEVHVFGDPKPGVAYVLRPGGYAVILDDRGALAVVATEEGLHLPGGGQEAGESPEIAAIREVAEETGLRVALQALIGIADELVFSRARATHYRKRCWFFRATVIGSGERVDEDHELRWMAPDEAIAGLHHEVQRWAVRKALGRRPSSGANEAVDT